MLVSFGRLMKGAGECVYCSCLMFWVLVVIVYEHIQWEHSVSFCVAKRFSTVCPAELRGYGQQLVRSPVHFGHLEVEVKAISIYLHGESLTTARSTLRSMPSLWFSPSLSFSISPESCLALPIWGSCFVAYRLAAAGLMSLDADLVEDV